MKKSIIAQAPATVANLICGFDTLALAIDNLYDQVELIPNDSGEFVITSIENGGNIPLDAKKNVCTAAMSAMRKDLADTQGFDVRIVKGYQAGSGLGSSAASSVAALWAYNAQLGFPLTKEEIIPYAMLGEELVSGKAIADNVAAATLGGIVLIRSDVEYDFVQLPVPDLYVGCLLPAIQIITKEARELLPTEVTLEKSVKQGANLAGFVSSLYSNDFELMKRSLHDHLIEQHRSPLIEHYDEAKKIAMDLGAISFGIGGSGPAVFYFCTDQILGDGIASAIKNMWARNQLSCTAVLGKINTKGVCLV